MLANSFNKKKVLHVFPKNFKRLSQPKDVVSERDRRSILEEVAYCRLNEKRLLKSKNYGNHRKKRTTRT